MKRPTIIIVDDNKGALTALRLLLRPYFQQVVELSDPNQLLETLRVHPEAGCLLLDMNFHSAVNNGNEGLFWLSEVKKASPGLPVVLFTAYAEIDLAVEGMKAGAADFVTKPWDNARLLATLLRAADSQEKKTNTPQKEDSGMYWGQTPAMMKIRQVAERVAPTEANVLITGENGTGKEVLAQWIHAQSGRAKSSMVAVDMGAVAPTLFESELFGHVKGAFTGAGADRRGKLVEANGSTLFLDEVGNLPLEMQPKLLAALQSRRVTPLGANKAVDIDVRLISATNLNVEEATSHGTFREDLLYRLNTITLHLPALRDRQEDILPLAERFLREFAHRYSRECRALSKEAQQRLLSYHWPGNIRQMRHAIERAVIISDGATVEESAFDLPMTIKTPQQISSTTTLAEMEQRMILEAIDRCEGNLSAAANELGITRQTLYNKLKKIKG
ncbi:MAG: sigma-54 dependent transcriptional regulator [Bacteroidales bacterium]|nr:sigma-54 dependent transcriptional regulator [Bacteroidales bacterium]